MQGQLVILKGNKYIREVEMLGDVEKITYFMVIDAKDDERYKSDLYKEVYDQTMAYDLEMAYEEILQAELTPQLFFI